MAQEYDEYKSAWPTVLGDKPQLTIQDGFPIEYNCEKVLEEGTLPPEALWFIFDYEVTLKHEPFGAFPADIRRDFEWSLLWNVAIEVGLNNCSLAGSGFQVVALGSQNDDMIDTEPAALDSNIFGGTCFSYDPACIPVKGIMNAKYFGNEKETEQYLRQMVQKVLGTNSILVDGVASVLYIGDRSTFSLYQLPPLATFSMSNQDDSGMESSGLAVVIGSLVGLGVVVTFIVGLFITRHFQKKQARKKNANSRLSITSIEFEAGSLDTKETEVSIEDTLPTSCDVDSFMDEELSRFDKPEEQDNIVTGNPPLAPKSVSLQTKRRRRRKKKKKRKKNMMVLTRSNSTNSMDTITEEDGEDQSDDDVSEDGSEYSTDDEDQDYHPKRSTSTGSLSSDLWDRELSHPLSMHLEEIVESPKIRKLPPPPV